MNIYAEIDNLLKYALKNEIIKEDDFIFMENGLLDILNLDGVEDFEEKEVLENNIEKILDIILVWASENGILESNTSVYRDLLDTKIMGVLTPSPSEVIREFNEKYKEDRKSATDYFYNLCKSTNYIRTERIAQNVEWETNTKYGDLQITINLSKPEKDPKAIAAAKFLPPAKYPKCLLCKENEGYRGRINHPARQNLRVIPLTLNNKKWFVQYSPYSYFNEHCIIFSSEHEPMKITEGTFERILEFVEKIPHYFAGSNADLPISGGSILTHDHYQGGNTVFPMDKAEVYKSFKIDGYEDIKGSIVKWPLTVVRLEGGDRTALSALGGKILEHWRNYSDENVGVISFTNETPHNTITPIAKNNNGEYILDLVLRNNRTSNEHPDGIFHPHRELHNIKKENIGLIEVLGLAILPDRLKYELEEVKNYLLGNECNMELIEKHIHWINDIKERNTNIIEDTVDKLVKNEVGFVFEKVLEHCGVFKWDEKGMAAIDRYLQDIATNLKK